MRRNPVLRRNIDAMLFWTLRWHEGRRVSYRVLCDVLWGDFAAQPVDPASSVRTLMASVQDRYRHKWIIEEAGRGFRIALRKPVSISQSRPSTYWKRRFTAVANDEVRRLDSLRPQARVLGFTPQEARALLRWADSGGANCAEVRDVTSAHLKKVRGKIARIATDGSDINAFLLGLEDSLSASVRLCGPGEPRRKCRLIAALSSAMTDPNPGKHHEDGL